MTTQTFRVLVVDDSSLTREALKRALELDPALSVVAEARTGEEALTKLRAVQPDLVTMDLNMPGMGGLKAIEAIMRERPTPVVVISEKSSTAGVDLNYEALSRGALELVPKSSVFGVGPDDVKRFAERLRLLAASRLPVDVRPAPAPSIPVSNEAPLLLGIGASTGGPRALTRLLAELPADFPLPICVVQHMAEDFFDSFVRFLSDASRRKVELAQSGVSLQPGRVYVAPPRKELFVKETMTMRLLAAPADALISPSVDSLFFSMANALKGRGIGVLLTGMGDDGAQGLLRMRRMGARTVAQSRESAAVFGMPRAAQELGAAEVVLDLEEMPKWLTRVASAGEQSQAKGEKLVDAKTANTGKKRVLVVDEDRAALEAVKVTLEGAGYEVKTLDNALMLASTLRRNTVELVLFETELSTMKGAVVLSALREHGLGEVPVFLHSKLEGPALENRAREINAKGAVTKGSPALLRQVTGFLGGPNRPLTN